ncbi:hypothetical protein AVEN_156791-1, partial [Araneus ventricosus]
METGRATPDGEGKVRMAPVKQKSGRPGNGEADSRVRRSLRSIGEAGWGRDQWPE